jgi:hypothetical protein
MTIETNTNGNNHITGKYFNSEAQKLFICQHDIYIKYIGLTDGGHLLVYCPTSGPHLYQFPPKNKGRLKGFRISTDRFR